MSRHSNSKIADYAMKINKNLFWVKEILSHKYGMSREPRLGVKVDD